MSCVTAPRSVCTFLVSWLDGRGIQPQSRHLPLPAGLPSDVRRQRQRLRQLQRQRQRQRQRLRLLQLQLQLAPLHHRSTLTPQTWQRLAPGSLPGGPGRACRGTSSVSVFPSYAYQSLLSVLHFDVKSSLHRVCSATWRGFNSTSPHQLVVHSKSRHGQPQTQHA